ncbi:MAG: hypothetical protein QOF91_1939 [Alphaproteobacteria bacterium]|nr:hypothetical protein [Alphaproteobacteria bacterium]
MAFQVGQVWTATFHEALRWATVIKIEKDGSLGLFCMDNLLYEEWVAWDQVAPSGPWELYTGRRPALPVEELVSRILRRAALSGACPPDVSAKIIPTLSGWFVQSIPPPGGQALSTDCVSAISRAATILGRMFNVERVP